MRVELLQSRIDLLAAEQGHGSWWDSWYLQHMQAVARFAAMIAERRGLDAELATMIGLLHDIHSLLTGNTEKHAKHGSELARKILTEMELASEEEKEIICTAIRYHSKKQSLHDEYSELAKDADVLSHYYHDGMCPAIEKDRERLEALNREFELSEILANLPHKTTHDAT